MSTGPAFIGLAPMDARRVALLSFERPPGRESPVLPASAELENCTNSQESKRVFISAITQTVRLGGRGAHRQDSKGTRWMPWHQEPKKDVDGCDKPR